MTENNNKVIRKSFAAANSYNGFISYFDKVFPSEEFSRIYVLKGGPGTGKSSMMRKLSSELHGRGCKVEEIYCSSDPHSLDGVIASSNKGRIAMIDGTAPHERDAVIPGAIDEIINLGSSWDTAWLTAKRKNITDLAKEKSEAYKTAYNYLKIAGEAANVVRNVCLFKFDNLKAKSEAESLLINIEPETLIKKHTRLLSSFGRYGEHTMDVFKDSEKQIIGILGNDYSASMILRECISKLCNIGVELTIYPSALDPQNIDAIELNNQKIIIKREPDSVVNADKCMNLVSVDAERIKKANYIRNEALLEAKRWFAVASDLHFRLEEIYTQAMDFEKNDKIFQTKMSEINNIL